MPQFPLLFPLWSNCSWVNAENEVARGKAEAKWSPSANYRIKRKKKTKGIAKMERHPQNNMALQRKRQQNNNTSHGICQKRELNLLPSDNNCSLTEHLAHYFLGIEPKQRNWQGNNQQIVRQPRGLFIVQNRKGNNHTKRRRKRRSKQKESMALALCSSSDECSSTSASFSERSRKAKSPLDPMMQTMRLCAGSNWQPSLSRISDEQESRLEMATSSVPNSIEELISCEMEKERYLKKREKPKWHNNREESEEQRKLKMASTTAEAAENTETATEGQAKGCLCQNHYCS